MEPGYSSKARGPAAEQVYRWFWEMAAGSKNDCLKPVPFLRFIWLSLSWAVMLAAWPLATAAQQTGGGAPIPPSQAEMAMDHFKSGGTHMDRGNLDQAIDDYTEAIQLKPNFFPAYLNRGTARRKKGEFDLAIGDYTAVIQMKPDLFDAYTLRGLCYEKKGQYRKAIADYTQALEKKPHYLTYIGLAWIFATSKDKKNRNGTRAVELAQKAVQLNRNARTLQILAAAYAEAGKFKEALETQETALDLLKQPGPVPKKDLDPYEHQLQAYKSNKPWRE